MRRFFALLAFLFLPLATCLEPTEVHVTVYTDICESLDVKIFVGGSQPVAEQRFDKPASCSANRRLGDIVFVPSKGGQRFTFRVQGARVGMMCPSKDCVIASRNIGYLSHTALNLDVQLTSLCFGVVCDPGKTCDRGQCVNEMLDCKDKTCGDGGVVQIDAPVSIEAAIDAPREAGGNCKADGDCTLFSSNCMTCACLALGPNDKPPTCLPQDQVSCFQDPCMGFRPSCSQGTCVALQ